MAERARGALLALTKDVRTRKPLSDQEVLRKSQTYPWMFGILVDRYQEAFLQRSLSILRSRETAEDVVQDTFVKIYKHAKSFSPRKGASFRSWAYKVLNNTCFSYIEERKKRNLREESMNSADLDLIESREVFGELNTSSIERVSLVQSILKRLPDHLSRLLRLYFFEEKSYQEIAEAERLSLSAVRSGLHRARKQFKNIAIKMI